MTEIILIIAGLLTIRITYLLGRRSGLYEANRSGISEGTWIEFKNGITVQLHGKNIKLRSGTQALVMDIDRWGGMSIWVIEPWIKPEDCSTFHRVREYSKVRIKNPNEIDKKIRQETTRKVASLKAQVADILGDFFH